MSFSFVAHAQQWSEVNDPFATREVYDAISYQNKLWLLDDGDAFQGAKSTKLRLKTWDNANWIEYPTYTPSGVDSIRGSKFVGADTSVYVAFQSFSSGITRAGLLRFDIPSESWSEVSSFDNKLDQGAEVRAMAWFNNQLYLAGNLPSFLGENQILRVIHAFAFAEDFAEVSGSIEYLEAYQGSLYFGGDYDSIGLVGAMLAVNNLASMQDDVFSGYSPSNGTTFFMKTLEKGELVFQEVRSTEERYLNLLSASGDEVMNYNFPNTFEILDYAIFDKQHFAIQNSPVERFGMGTYRFDNGRKKWTSFKTGLNPASAKLVYAGRNLYLVEKGQSTKHIEALGLAYLGGRVFVEVDGDCAKTAGDRMIGEGIFVEDGASGGVWYTEPGTGIFGAYVGEGNYDLKIPNIPVRFSSKVCMNGIQGTIANGDSIYINIPLSIVDTTPLVNITISSPRGFRARQGFKEEFILQVYNEGFRIQNCPIHLQMPKEIQFVGADIMPIDSGADGNYIWNLVIAPFEKKEIHFFGSVELTTPAYTKVVFSAWSDSLCLRANNKDSLVQKVVGAYDPNDKQNFPDSIITKKTKEIRYHIRFQNTGTDTALNVWVIDTLDLRLPLAYVKLDAVSHPFRLLKEPLSYGVQIYEFENIMLPDSGTNMEASNGYITYHVGLTENINHGDVIENRAFIYFDYQHPIETNTVQNEMRDEESGEVPVVGTDDPYLVYPNPSKGKFQVVNFTQGVSSCKLYDAQGKDLGTWMLGADSETVLDLSRLSPGIYYLRFPDWNAQESLVITQ